MPIISNFPGGSLPEGKSGQFVGFDPAGAPVAKNVTAQDVAFTDGETFQTKYDSGELTGPAGQDGAAGAPGKDGAAATVTVGKVTTGAAGSQAAVTNSGSTSAAVFDFKIPRGADGAVGPAGKDGAQGAPGPAGKSAYQSAQENGYTGSEAEFYAALVALKDGPFLPLKGGRLEDSASITWGDGTAAMAASNDVGLLVQTRAKLINVDDSVISNLGTPTGEYHAATKGYVDGVRPKGKKYTLTAAGWSSSAKTQTITVTGVLADEAKQLIMPMPASASQDAYATAGIACTAQGANSLTFKCQTVPTADITVYVAVQEVTQG